MTRKADQIDVMPPKESRLKDEDIYGTELEKNQDFKLLPEDCLPKHRTGSTLYAEEGSEEDANVS